LIDRDAAFFMGETIKYELAMEDRIDAMIDRAVKCLVRAKAMKQMLGTASPNEGSEQFKNLPSKKPNGPQKIRAPNGPGG
jgi:hypothetical protein